MTGRTYVQSYLIVTNQFVCKRGGDGMGASTLLTSLVEEITDSSVLKVEV